MNDILQKFKEKKLHVQPMLIISVKDCSFAFLHGKLISFYMFYLILQQGKTGLITTLQLGPDYLINTLTFANYYILFRVLQLIHALTSEANGCMLQIRILRTLNIFPLQLRALKTNLVWYPSLFEGSNYDWKNSGFSIINARSKLIE